MQINQSISEAVYREKKLGKYLLKNLFEKMRIFEHRYKMKSSMFIKKFEKGALDDREDFFEWFSLYKGMKYWENKLKELTI